MPRVGVSVCMCECVGVGNSEPPGISEARFMVQDEACILKRKLGGVVSVTFVLCSQVTLQKR